jgi:hypothetical protein
MLSPSRKPVPAIKLELERLKKDAADFGRYSIHLSIVLSLVLSLAAAAIISKSHLTDSLSISLLVFAVPIPIALYFRKRIILIGTVVYALALIASLLAAVLFGV